MDRDRDDGERGPGVSLALIKSEFRGFGIAPPDASDRPVADPRDGSRFDIEHRDRPGSVSLGNRGNHRRCNRAFVSSPPFAPAVVVKVFSTRGCGPRYSADLARNFDEAVPCRAASDPSDRIRSSLLSRRGAVTCGGPVLGPAGPLRMAIWPLREHAVSFDPAGDLLDLRPLRLTISPR